MTWVETVNALGFAAVAAILRLEQVTATSWRPCPSCDADSRGTGARRGPIGCGNGMAWRCWRCGAQGSPASLVAAVMLGEVPAAGDGRWRLVRERCGELGLLDETSRPPVASTAPVAGFPPAREVTAFLAQCDAACGDAQVSAWLRSRGIDANEASIRDLVLALPQHPNMVPHWAVRGRYAWHQAPEQYRAIVRLVDASGETRSVHARAVGKATGQHKATSPKGFSTSGLVMANRLGVKLLQGALSARAVVAASHAALNFAGDMQPFGLVVVEGVPDFLVAATTWTVRPFPAVLGIISGSWKREFAQRIPKGTRVLVATDPDAAGDEYAVKVARTLGHCEVFRWRASDDVAAVGLANGQVEHMDTSEGRRTA